jgi:hypothetical protein
MTATATAATPRILLAPVTVSPTKPLTPTHLKYLVSLDMLYRATSTFAEVTFLYDHSAYVGSRQVAGFWAYLDGLGEDPEPGYARMNEEEIGELYAAYHRAGRTAQDAAAAPGARPARRPGGMHPVSARLLDLWEEHYRLLGMFDPQLGRSGPAPAAEDEVLGLLADRDLCIDARELGAPVYLDATTAGLPLRTISDPDGQPNYLLLLLRQLLPLIGGHDVVVLAHDVELRTDYRTVAHVLTALGAEVVRYEVPRVPVDGSVRSTRYGGWQGYTLGAFSGPLVEEFGADVFRLGLRLYLVAGLGRTAPQSFSADHLRRWMRRARRLLDRHGGGVPAPAEVTAAGGYLAARAGRRRFADPYQVTGALVSRDPAVPVGGLLHVVMGQTEEAGVPAGAGR